MKLRTHLFVFSLKSCASKELAKMTRRLPLPGGPCSEFPNESIVHIQLNHLRDNSQMYKMSAKRMVGILVLIVFLLYFSLQMSKTTIKYDKYV